MIDYLDEVFIIIDYYLFK